MLPGEGAVLRPKGIEMHYEVELALVIGKLTKDLQASDVQGAMDAVKGARYPTPTSQKSSNADIP